jgi:hypothetical protein
MDKAIMLPLTTWNAAQHPFGHTALATFFSYVPTVGMAGAALALALKAA